MHWSPCFVLVLRGVIGFYKVDRAQSIVYPAAAISMSRKRHTVVATCLAVFALAGLSFPFYMASKSSKSKPVIDSSKALPPQATFRGPYINTGSRDIGPDQQSYPRKP